MLRLLLVLALVAGLGAPARPATSPGAGGDPLTLVGWWRVATTGETVLIDPSRLEVRRGTRTAEGSWVGDGTGRFLARSYGVPPGSNPPGWLGTAAGFALDGPNRVGRVIARPFAGAPGHFARTTRRHDYAVDPPKPMLLDVLAERGVPVFGIGKIHDIYNGRCVEKYVTTTGNADGMAKLAAALQEQKSGLIFCNLVDFDMLYGHRKDVEGFAESLEEFDRMLGPFLKLLSGSDLLLITADHGCDPDPRWATTDHSREYVPILAYSPDNGAGVNLGVRSTLADMGQTIAQNFGGEIPHGKSFLREIS